MRGKGGSAARRWKLPRIHCFCFATLEVSFHELFGAGRSVYGGVGYGPWAVVWREGNWAFEGYKSRQK